MSADTETFDQKFARQKAVLDLIADPDDWKNPIEATINADAATDAAIIEAVTDMTGSFPTIVPNADGTKTVLADGYYLTMVDPDIDL